MDSQHSEENSMESHTEDDDSIMTEERDESSSEDEQSRITTENSSEEELNPWTTLINDAASKVRDQYEDILQAILMEGHDESEAKQEAFAQMLPVFQKELADVYMNNLAWMKASKKTGWVPDILYTFKTLKYKSTYFKGYWQPCQP